MSLASLSLPATPPGCFSVPAGISEHKSYYRTLLVYFSVSGSRGQFIPGSASLPSATEVKIEPILTPSKMLCFDTPAWSAFRPCSPQFFHLCLQLLSGQAALAASHQLWCGVCLRRDEMGSCYYTASSTTYMTAYWASSSQHRPDSLA